jgi:hypothetical protein
VQSGHSMKHQICGTGRAICTLCDQIHRSASPRRHVQNDWSPAFEVRNLGRRQLSRGMPIKIQSRFHSLGTALEEADESAFWIELLVDAAKTTSDFARPLLGEANELTAIAASSINTAKSNLK